MEKIEFTLTRGQSMLHGLLKAGIALDHDCGGTLACASCCVVVRGGFEHLGPASEDEQDMLERSGARDPHARLACQAVGEGGMVAIEVPKGGLPQRSGPVLGTALPILLSERAAKHLAAQLARAGSAAVRIALEPSGCSGLRYRFDSAGTIGADDMVFESHGVRIALDPASLPYVQGAMIDLVQEGLARKLRLHNPNARQTCGCGESFAV